jgi:hypothetical protein
MQNEIDKSLIYEVYADVHEMEGKINKAFSMLKSALKLSNDPFQSEHLISNIKRLRRKRWALFLF